MVNYFEGFKLYKWEMTDKQGSKIQKKVDELDWNVILIIQLLLIPLTLSLMEIIRTYGSYNLTDLSWTLFLLVMFYNMIYIMLYVFGGYYVLKSIFKTKLTLIDFSKALIYLQLPIFMIILAFALLTFLFWNSYEILKFLIYSAILIILYFGIQQIVTLIFYFKKKFNTTGPKLVVAVFFWVLFLRIMFTIIVLISSYFLGFILGLIKLI